MSEVKHLCRTCGSASTDQPIVCCPSCGAVLRWRVAGTFLLLAVACATALAAVASGWVAWVRVAGCVLMLASGWGFWETRSALRKAGALRLSYIPGSTPPGKRPDARIEVALALAGVVVFGTPMIAFYESAFTSKDLPPSSPPPAAHASHPARKENPLPVAVTFRPAPTGIGQTLYLAGDPRGKPLTVRVTTPRDDANPRVPLTVPGRSPVKNAPGLVLELLMQKEEEERKYPLLADVVVRPGVETEVVWAGDRTFRLKPGQTVTLTSPGYDALTTSTSVPLRQPAPASGAPPATSADALKELEGIKRQVRQARTTNATALVLDGKFDEAIKEFDAILAEDPKDVYARNGRGFAFAQKGDLVRAFADLDESVRLRPEWAPTYRLRGQALFARKEYRAALGEYASAIRLDPKADVGLLSARRDPFSAYLERALVRLELGEFDGVAGDCSDELRLNPDSPEAYAVRAEAHRKAGNDAAAKADLARAIELRNARKKP